ncbi:formate dehydrogenase accessory protein FdhE [Mesorhizobium sp. ANAO-SY3R2]|uniref:formate dehydrogenase accessory protein FdhE n=1 Tax=Mesorhizobium sp. ANAO-SY3R2 TaxID=3166644 RepID=UPI003670B067
MGRKGAIVADPTAIGDVSSPPFVRLPDPISLFSDRARRLRALAETSDLAPYLTFLADLAQAQHDVQSTLPPPVGPDAAAVMRAREFEMPPLLRNGTEGDETTEFTFDRLFAAADEIEKPAAAAEALLRVRKADPAQRRSMMQAVFDGVLPDDVIAECIYVWAALQLHLARLASGLDPSSLVPVAEGVVCPVCGGKPSSSMVVGWQGSHGARFCTCSLCSTLWHYVRIKCILCGSTKGISYQEIEGQGGTVKAETCEECRGWSKIFYQTKDPAIDPVADDVASLGLDLLMRELHYRHGGFAPLLAGL